MTKVDRDTIILTVLMLAAGVLTFTFHSVIPLAAFLAVLGLMAWLD
jgi:hypothetical protein